MSVAAALLAKLNPPGERQLHYRVGTYHSFLQEMLAELPRHQVQDGTVAVRPLEVLDPGTSRDFAAALLDAWAMVGDVLTFYQERMLNEGYLRTAVQAASVRDLTAELGFPLQPGIAASTWLAFAVSAAPGSPDGIEIPAGTAAQSIPGTGEQPQTFETSQPVVARPAWNSMVPAPSYATLAQSLAVTDTQARLAGTGTGLSVGAPLLAAAGDGSAWSFGTVTTVEPNAPSRETRVAWTPADAGTQGTGTMASPAVYAFGRGTHLFGYNAAEWSALTTEQKRAYRQILGGVFVLADGTDDWAAASGRAAGDGGLPAVDVRALAVDEAGQIYAGTTGQGIYVSGDGGGTWSSGGPRWSDVYSLAAGAPGRVYAGMAGGRLYRSCDGGQSWDSISGATTLATTQPGSPPQVLGARLPSAPVRAVFEDGAGVLYAGTDFGVYVSAEATPAWSPLPLYPDALATAPAARPAAAASPAVWSLALAPWGKVAVGTDQGVYTAETGLPLGAAFPLTLPSGMPNVVRALLADGPALLAGSDAGLLELLGHGRGEYAVV
ncbi:MAG TPA: hypothetical protein VJT67_05715, partial [Longimicrobiaceae bacterium]|nr:hypothetical protein [Longimicrobiaceae bacterium]